MTLDEFESLAKIRPTPVPVLTAEDLENKKSRTLIWGYTPDRESFHVYLGDDGLIHKVVYRGSLEPVMILHVTNKDVSSNSEYVPSKRLYPEACDAEFCGMLLERGIELSFTNYNPNRDLSISFHGKKVEELLQPGRHLI